MANCESIKKEFNNKSNSCYYFCMYCIYESKEDKMKEKLFIHNNLCVELIEEDENMYIVLR